MQEKDNFVFFGKLIIIAIYLSKTIIGLGHVDLPLLFIFKPKFDFSYYYYVWQILFLSSSILVFLNKQPKLFLFFDGILIIFALLMNELCYSNNLFFAACMLITFSISNKFNNYARFQLSIVYFGAFIDKLLYKQWRNGDFMTAYFQNKSIIIHLKPIIDPHTLIMIMTYSTLIIELSLAILILIPRMRNIFLILGLCFHFSTIILMNDFFGIFILIILISYFSLINTPIDFNENLKFPNQKINFKWLMGGFKSAKKYKDVFKLNKFVYSNYKTLFVGILTNSYTIIFFTILFTTNLKLVKIILLFSLIIFLGIFTFKDKNTSFNK